jgi:hypothetical protein
MHITGWTSLRIMRIDRGVGTVGLLTSSLLVYLTLCTRRLINPFRSLLKVARIMQIQARPVVRCDAPTRSTPFLSRTFDVNEVLTAPNDSLAAYQISTGLTSQPPDTSACFHNTCSQHIQDTATQLGNNYGVWLLSLDPDTRLDPDPTQLLQASWLPEETNPNGTHGMMSTHCFPTAADAHNHVAPHVQILLQ